MRWLTPVNRLTLFFSMLTGALTHGYNLFNYPLYVTDEGIYIQQAWSVLREARLSPYTYFYDHAPAGWLVIAAWVAILPSQFQTFGSAIDTGRALMLLNRPEEAASALQQTLALEPDNADAAWLLRMVNSAAVNGGTAVPG